MGAPDMIEIILEAAFKHGLFPGLVCYFIWRQQKSYDRVCARLNEVEDFQTSTLIKALAKSTGAIEKVSDAIAKCRKVK